MIKQIALVSGFAALSLAAFSTAEEVTFQLKFEPGKTYLSETDVKQNMVMPMGGQEMKTAMTMRMVSSQKVTKAEEGLQVVQGMESMNMDMDAAGMKMAYDSKNPQGPMAAMFGSLMDAKTTLVIDEKGKLVSVKADAIPGMENMGMGPEEMEQAAREMSDMMPNKAVAVGDSWKSTTTMPMGGITEPVSINYVMTFQEMTELEGSKVAKVDIKGEVNADDGNLQVTSKELKGHMLFDPKIGQPREYHMIVDLEIGLPEGEDVAEGAPGKIPMRTETVTRLKEIQE